MSNSDHVISRRRILQAGATGGAALAIGSLLSACQGTSSTSSASSSSQSAGKPKRGGTLTAGMISAGTSETINPAALSAYPDLTRGYQLYNTLFSIDSKLQVVSSLATDAKANANATKWTFTLRSGVEWHDGKSLTADDVVYTFQQWANPENFGHAVIAGVVDFKNVRKTGNLTVEIPLLKPVAELPSLFCGYTNFVVQNGSTAASARTHPVGTGPFKFESFTPGSQSVFVRNPNYWENGKPYVDRLVINTSFTSEPSRLNALLSGSINVLPLLPYTSAKAQQAAGRITVLDGGAGPGAYTFAMRTDVAPFKDVRLRQALKLIIDRKELVDSALDGFGTVGNDLYGKGLKYYDSTPAEHDPDKGKALLKAAGLDGLSLELPLAAAGPGYAEATTLFAAQLNKAGIKTKLNNIPVESFYAVTAGGYLSRPFQLSQNAYSDGSLASIYRGSFVTGAPTDESHWGSAAHDSVINAAIGAVSTAEAQERWNTAQKQQITDGGEIVWAYGNNVDACAKNVKGLASGPNWYLNEFRFLDGWIA